MPFVSTASLTECSLGGNSLGDEGTEYIATALKENATSKLQKLSMWENGIGPKGAAALAAYMAVSASLKKVCAAFSALPSLCMPLTHIVLLLLCTA